MTDMAKSIASSFDEVLAKVHRTTTDDIPNPEIVNKLINAINGIDDEASAEVAVGLAKKVRGRKPFKSLKELD